MRDFDENSITQAVVASFANTPDPRLKQIMASLVSHLHGFVRDVGLTTAEWQRAIEFLTRTGHSCDAHRQEFILLSDTLGVSMLVDAINHQQGAGATETTVLGPFYVQSPPVHQNGADISGGFAGTPLLVSGTVVSADGAPLAGATVDVWHSDEEGFYDVQQLEKLEGFSGRARFETDSDGRFHFWSVVPSHYPIPHDGPVGDMLQATSRHPYRPAHVHFMIGAPGHETLVTHVFMSDSQYLDSDAVFAVKSSLIAEFTHEPPGTAAGRSMDEPYRRLDHRFGLKVASNALEVAA